MIDFLKRSLNSTLVSYRILNYMYTYRRRIDQEGPDDFIDSLVTGILIGIESLALVGNIIIPLAWKNHAVYLQITKRRDEIYYYLQNYGDGADLMHFYTTDPTKIYPYAVFPQSAAATDLTITPKKYIGDLLTLSSVEKKKDSLISVFYLHGKSETASNSWPHPPQPRFCCTSYGYLKAQDVTEESINYELEALSGWSSAPKSESAEGSNCSIN
jgi:hypothetical protein